MLLSYETAASVYNWANVFLIGALLVGFVATALVVKMGNIKEAYLKRDIATANAESARAHERAAQAEERTAEANKKAEEERLARVKIEEKLAPRRLTQEQQSSISEHMSSWAKLPGTKIRQSVAVFPSSPSFESAVLADQIAAVLERAGWDMNRNAVTFGMSFSVAGVGILTSSNPRSIAVAEALAEALNSERIYTFIFREQRHGCEEMNLPKDKIDTDPACSQISVFVGDHP